MRQCLTLGLLQFICQLGLEGGERRDGLVHTPGGALHQSILHHIHLAQVVLHVGGDHLLRVVLTHLRTSLESCL